MHAVAHALLEKSDMTGKECIEIIQSAANGSTPVDSEHLLKELVEETIVSANGKSEEKSKARTKRKANPKLANK